MKFALHSTKQLLKVYTWKLSKGRSFFKKQFLSDTGKSLTSSVTSINSGLIPIIAFVFFWINKF